MTNFSAHTRRWAQIEANFQAGRLVSAIVYLNAAMGALEDIDTVACSAYKRITAERWVLITEFRATAANAGWDTAKIEEVCS